MAQETQPRAHASGRRLQETPQTSLQQVGVSLSLPFPLCCARNIVQQNVADTSSV